MTAVLIFVGVFVYAALWQAFANVVIPQLARFFRT